MMPNGEVKHTDHTAVRGFEKAAQNVIPIQPWQCPYCLERFGQKGRKSAQVTIMTAKGQDKWCKECYEKGVEKGICLKVKKLSKKERKKMRIDKWQN